MRLVSYEDGDGPRAGILRDDRVHAVEGRAARRSTPCSPRAALGACASGDAARRRRACCRRSARPGKIICIGLNYRSHARGAGREPPETPTFFAKFANALARARRDRGAARASSRRWTTRPRWRS